MRQAIAELNLPPDYQVVFTGRAKTMQETFQNFFIAFGLAMIFMYMILAAQFEHFVHPISIMLAVPLSLPFALLTMVLLREPLNIYAIFGLFMLFGIVKKNGILQVDYTNTLRARGMDREAAILQANRVRLRPILMTTMMLVASMIPIALGTGPGSGGRASMAKVIIGGQMLCLLLTLLVTPISYSIFDDWGAGKFFRVAPPQVSRDCRRPTRHRARTFPGWLKKQSQIGAGAAPHTFYLPSTKIWNKHVWWRKTPS